MWLMRTKVHVFSCLQQRYICYTSLYNGPKVFIKILQRSKTVENFSSIFNLDEIGIFTGFAF